MSFNCPAQTSLTDTEANATYGAAVGANPGLLGSSASDRDSQGMLSATALSQMVASLKNASVIPIATTGNADAYVAKVGTFLSAVQAEYCFYESRYKYALDKLINAVRQGYITNTAEAQSQIKKYLELTQTLNKKLNDFTQIVNRVTEDILTASDTLNAEVQVFNKKIQDQRVLLDQQNKIITSGEAAITIRKEMVKFTEEKARNSDNLLKLYGFLNVVVLGLLVYVYKAASD